MTIHIIEAKEKPTPGSVVQSNCDRQIAFDKSISAEWSDGRVCDKCLEVHRTSKSVNLKTFAFVQQ
jgi:hypothetical protein